MTAKFIVADDGPLIALAVGGVLPDCIGMLGGLMVPEAVLDECTSDISAPGAVFLRDLRAAHRFQTLPSASLMPLDPSFAHGLGGGEIAVLSYAAQNGLLALIDERRARRAPAARRTVWASRPSAVAPCWPSSNSKA